MGAAAFGGIVGKDFANKALGQIAFGALSGAIGAEATGGEWWRGAIIGGMVAGLNHAMHDAGYSEEGGGPGDPPTTLDKVQMALDGIGVTEIPFVSQGAELISAGISLYNGDVAGFGIGLGSMIPGGGKYFEGMKVARYGVKYSKLLKSAENGRAAHKALKNKVLAKGNGWQAEPKVYGKNGKWYRPDIVTPSNNFIELKPNTISGRLKGYYQANTYRKQLGMHGRVIYY